MEIFDIKELIKLIYSGNREYVVLLDYLRYVKEIKDIEKLEKEIKEIYPKEQEIYIELSNYYTRNKNISKSIENLEKYKENGGKDLGALKLLEKQYDIYQMKKEENNIVFYEPIDLLSIFNEKYNIDILIRKLENILKSNKIYDYYELSCYIGKFLHELNLKHKISEVELFFNKIYHCISIEQLKLRNIILNEYEIATKKHF